MRFRAKYASSGPPFLDGEYNLLFYGIGETVDQLFFLTLLIIFLSALVGVVVQRRSRDRCLRNFSNQPVTIKMNNGQENVGALQVYASGLEVTFTQRHEGPQDPDSIIIYSAEYDQIQMITRRVGKHEARVNISRHMPLTRIMRQSQNVLNTFQDAVQQAFGFVLLQAQQNRQNRLLMSQDKNLKSIGGNVLSAMTNAYEPILEKYLGKRVVIEFLPNSDEETPTLLAGVLREYTRTWIELHALDHSQHFDMDAILPRSRAVLRHTHREALRLEAKPECVSLESAAPSAPTEADDMAPAPTEADDMAPAPTEADDMAPAPTKADDSIS